jgi:hypothetical protein
MSDKLVFDLAQEVEGSPSVFIRKDWLNILDNQNQNYNNNQSIVDTSQLSNSNKYMSYRESYFLIPMTLTLQQTDVNDGFVPSTSTADYAVGLKNWFGQIIHSFTLDYNGTTIVQQTPYVNMWNSFKLMTSLSYSDITTQGATIGFFPDDSQTWTWTPTPAVAGGIFTLDSRAVFGQGICNNTDVISAVGAKNISSQFNQFTSGAGNIGYLKRNSWINYDACGLGLDTVLAFNADTYPTAYSELLTAAECSLLWKSHIFNKVNSDVAIKGTLQIGVTATVYLKHIHSFFNMCPLLKGVFMKMTMNLNNTSTSFSCGWNAAGDTPFIACTSVANPLGGVNPSMVSSIAPIDIRNLRISSTSASLVGTGVGGLVITGTAAGGVAGDRGLAVSGSTYNTASAPTATSGALLAGQTATLSGVLTSASSILSYKSGATTLLPPAGINEVRKYRYNVSVGSRCLDSQITSAGENPMSKSIYLYIPSYTFNPVFEQAYLSSPVKQIKYTDIYQYQVLSVGAGAQFNNLLTNGIANVKSVLILPFYSSAGLATTGSYNTEVTGVSLSPNSGFLSGVPVFQSPFDPVGTGPTSPLCLIKNFNIQVSGQNAIYNMEKYPFEQFNNQLYGQNAVNGGLTDGITSGLIDRQAFDMEYSYYYVNVERMLPVEMSVPKSIQILGTNSSTRAIDLYCFVEYGVEISIDALTGARV